MKKLLVILSMFFLMIGCKSSSVEEAFHSKHPDNEILHIHIDENNKGAVVFYKAPFTSGVGIGAAIIKGNSSEGYEYFTSSSIYNRGFIFNSERVSYLEDSSIRLFYGIIDDAHAEQILIEDKHGNKVKANLINTDWKRIWYAIVPVQGQLKLWVYDHDGNVLFRIPANASSN